MEKKLKRLLETVPPGYLIDSAWAARHEISRASIHSYVRQGWLESVARGVQRRPFMGNGPVNPELDWQTPVISAQSIMGYRFHVGGMRALSLQGYAHYIPAGIYERVQVYGKDAPKWLFELNLKAKLEWRKRAIFKDDELGVTDWETGSAASSNNLALRISTPERAIIEFINDIPKLETFHTIDVVFQGLSSLRPRLLMDLLRNCTSVKAKRLFLVFAERHGHAWFKHMDIDRIDIGSGDRSVEKGGKIHPRFRVTVPAEYLADTGKENA